MFVICWVVKHKVASLVNHSWRRERSGRQKRCSTKSKRFKDFDEIADFFWRFVWRKRKWDKNRGGRQKRCSTKTKRFKKFDEIADFLNKKFWRKRKWDKTRGGRQNAALQNPKRLNIFDKIALKISDFSEENDKEMGNWGYQKNAAF